MTTDLSWSHKWACNNFGFNLATSASFVFPFHMIPSFWIPCFALLCHSQSVHLITEILSLLTFSYHHYDEEDILPLLLPFLSLRYQCYASEHGYRKLSPTISPSVPRVLMNFTRAWKWGTWKPWIFSFCLGEFYLCSHWSSPAGIQQNTVCESLRWLQNWQQQPVVARELPRYH